MRVMRQEKRQGVILMTLAGCLLLIFASFVNGETSSSEMSVNETLLIQGVVRQVLPDKDTVVVKVRQGGKMNIRVSPQTRYVDIISIEELKRGERVKVWYIVVGEENWAIKFEKMPELGC